MQLLAHVVSDHACDHEHGERDGEHRRIEDELAPAALVRRDELLVAEPFGNFITKWRRLHEFGDRFVEGLLIREFGAQLFAVTRAQDGDTHAPADSGLIRDWRETREVPLPP